MAQHTPSEKKWQLIFLFFYELIAGFISIHFNLNALWYLCVSWIIPVIFFLYKLSKDRYKYIFEGLMWSIPGSILIDWVGHYSKAWSYWENHLFASTGITVFGIPIESFIWGSALWIFYVVVYEYFFDKNRAPNFRKKEKITALGFTILGLIIIPLINSYNPTIPLFYGSVIFLFSFITILFLIKYKSLTIRMIEFGYIVFILGLQIEYFSLKLNLWTFPDGDFIKKILFFGHIIPLEEVLWWLIIPVTIATAHEVFADNHK